MLHPRLATLLAAVSLACGLYISAAAQTVTGSMEGRVIDQTGAVIHGAKVAIRNVETGQERVVITNAEGFYRAPFLPLGVYRVIASSQGFANVTQENIQVTLNQTVVANFELKPSTASAEVTIRVDEVQINTTNAEIKQALSSQRTSEGPPLIQGSFLPLAEPSTGFKKTPTGGKTIRRCHQAPRLISTERARAARRFKSTASTMTIRLKTS